MIFSAGTTVYLKIIDKKGVIRVEQRETWDVERFVKNVKKQYKEDKENPCEVELSTRTEYFEHLKRNGQRSRSPHTT
jgi:hypothetical protein